LVTHRFKFEEAIIAFKATQAGRSDDGKAVIKAIISGPECWAAAKEIDNASKDGL